MNYPVHCCQECGADLGFVGVFFRLIGISDHVCKTKKPWTVDRDGRVRTDRDRPVMLKGKTETTGD